MKTIVIGAGASGLVAAIAAANAGSSIRSCGSDSCC
ncbi:FAD-binding protein [Parabacteroides distasonis]|nr:FAD-binding protein [Parabacteroides distasonis]